MALNSRYSIFGTLTSNIRPLNSNPLRVCFNETLRFALISKREQNAAVLRCDHAIADGTLCVTAPRARDAITDLPTSSYVLQPFCLWRQPHAVCCGFTAYARCRTNASSPGTYRHTIISTVASTTAAMFVTSRMCPDPKIEGRSTSNGCVKPSVPAIRQRQTQDTTRDGTTSPPGIRNRIRKIFVHHGLKGG